MYKILTICLSLLILCSVPAMAEKSTAQSADIVKAPATIVAPSATASAGSALARLPDLIVTSANVTSAPWSYGDLMFIPLQITVKNQGGSTTQEFAAFVKTDIARWRAIAKSVGVLGENNGARGRQVIHVRGGKEWLV